MAQDDVVVDGRGGVRAVRPEAAARLAAAAGGYRLVVPATGLLVLQGEGPAGGRARVLMAGEVVSRMTVLEVVNVVASTMWHGSLVVAPAAGPTRTLQFDQGALRSARSDAPGDRLGEVLYRMGRIDRPTLHALAEVAADDRALSAACLEHGLLDQEGLFAAARRQAEEVFHGALLVADGTYVFRTGEADDASALRHVPALLHLPVQALLMEGVQRIDEMALFREQIPSADLVPELRPGAAPTGSQEATLLRVSALVDGRRSIAEIARASGLGEFATTKALYQLVKLGAAVLRTGQRLDEAAARRLVAQVNGITRDVFVAAATYGGIDQTRASISAWIHGSDYAELLGEEVDVDGSLDAAVVVANLRALAEGHPLERLHLALHELAAFALFAASTSLPRDQEVRLSRDVNRRLQALRL